MSFQQHQKEQFLIFLIQPLYFKTQHAIFFVLFQIFHIECHSRCSIRKLVISTIFPFNFSIFFPPFFVSYTLTQVFFHFVPEIRL